MKRKVIDLALLLVVFSSVLENAKISAFAPNSIANFLQPFLKDTTNSKEVTSNGCFLPFKNQCAGVNHVRTNKHPPFLFSSSPTSSSQLFALTLNKDNVYQAIWDADQRGNGIPAIDTQDESTPRDKTRGYVLVDETEDDDDDHKVLPEVVIPDEKKGIYDKCELLLDNYETKEVETKNNMVNPDTLSVTEIEEINDFIMSIKDSAPMRIAREYLDPDQTRYQTDDEWVNAIETVWFRQGDSFGKKNNLRSGFEHVFVGEITRSRNGYKIGGYHYWHKYFLDDGGNSRGEDTIDNDGAEYDRSGQLLEEGMKTPEVVTLDFKWDPLDDEGPQEKSPRGGFWVGCSPEGLIALGMARTKEKEDDETFANINNVRYMMKLFMLTNEKDSINTFWPRFESIIPDGEKISIDSEDLDRFFLDVVPPPLPPPVDVIPPPVDVTPTPTPTPVSPAPLGDVRIIAALVNPENDDTGKEKVTLANFGSDEVDVQGWEIAGNNENGFNIDEKVQLGSGDFFTFLLPEKTAQLRNKRNSKITLIDDSGSIVQQVTYAEKPESGEIIFFRESFL